MRPFCFRQRTQLPRRDPQMRTNVRIKAPLVPPPPVHIHGRQCYCAVCCGVRGRYCAFVGVEEQSLVFKGNKRIWNLCHVGKQRAYVCVDGQTHSGRSCLASRWRDWLMRKKSYARVQRQPSDTFHSLTSKISPCDCESQQQNSLHMFTVI